MENELIMYTLFLTVLPVDLYKIETSGCGVRISARQPREVGARSYYNDQINTTRSAKIMFGSPAQEGQYPWQASLELLHPSIGFIGHWCGGVLIEKYWIISAAHCIQNDLFNLPLPALWTAVLGEHNREDETGYEQRIPIEKIFIHDSYQHFMNDISLLKLSKSAHITPESHVAKICLPFSEDLNYISMFNDPLQNEMNLYKNEVLFHDDEIYSRKNGKSIKTARDYMDAKLSKFENLKVLLERKNDKLSRSFVVSSRSHSPKSQVTIQEQSYFECIATGWGVEEPNGALTKILHQTSVPIHSIEKCDEVYLGYINLQQGHICAGNLNKDDGASCFGDSGGPLQCRTSNKSPWVLVGITSFGSGCTIPGYPDVYTKISHYKKWIIEVIKHN